MNFYPIEIKFRNGDGQWGLNAETLIKTVSPKRIHVESKFPDGRSFSSRASKKGSREISGVSFKNIGYSHPERWTTYVLWVTKEELDNILFDCELLAATGAGYDYRGAIGCAITGHQNPWLWFCSEVVFDRVCTKWYSFRLNYKMHPDKFEELVVVLEAKLLERKFNVDGI